MITHDPVGYYVLGVITGLMIRSLAGLYWQRALTKAIKRLEIAVKSTNNDKRSTK